MNTSPPLKCPRRKSEFWVSTASSWVLEKTGVGFASIDPISENGHGPFLTHYPKETLANPEDQFCTYHFRCFQELLHLQSQSSLCCWNWILSGMLLGAKLCPSPIHTLNPLTPNASRCDCIWRLEFQAVLKLKWGHSISRLLLRLLFLACGWPPSHYVVMWLLFCVCVSVFQSHLLMKTLVVQNRTQPNDLRNPTPRTVRKEISVG